MIWPNETVKKSNVLELCFTVQYSELLQKNCSKFGFVWLQLLAIISCAIFSQSY